jgi:hypothetical protein
MVSTIFQSPMRLPSREPARRAGLAHALLAAGDDDLGVAAQHRLHGQMHGAQAAAADLVDGHGRHLVRQPGVERGLPRRVLADAGGEHLAEDHLVDLLRLQPGALQQGLDDDGAEGGGGQRCEGAAEAADGGAGCGDDDGVWLMVVSSSGTNACGVLCSGRWFFGAALIGTPLIGYR